MVRITVINEQASIFEVRKEDLFCKVFIQLPYEEFFTKKGRRIYANEPVYNVSDKEMELLCF